MTGLDARHQRPVVFDFGGVLVDWNPRYLYRQLFDDQVAMERFLTFVCSTTWNLLQDAGRSFDEAVAELSARFPEQRTLIEAYHHRWEEMVAGPIQGSVTILEALKAQGTPLYGITNWSSEKFSLTRQRFGFFELFDGITVSGEVKLIKPDPAIFLLSLENFDLRAEDCVFIDDSFINCNAARKLGMTAVEFHSAEDLGKSLRGLGILN